MHWFRYVCIFITSISATLLIVFGVAAYSTMAKSKRDYLWLLGIPATILYMLCFLCIGYGNWYPEFECVKRLCSWSPVCCGQTSCCCCTGVESADKYEKGVFSLGGGFRTWATSEEAPTVRKSNYKKRFITDYFGLSKANSSVYSKMRENIPPSPVDVRISLNSAIESDVEHKFRRDRFTVIPVEEHHIDEISEVGEASLDPSNEIRPDLPEDAELRTPLWADQLFRGRSVNADESEKRQSWHDVYRKVLLAAKRGMEDSLKRSRSVNQTYNTDEEALTEVDSAELDATANNILENLIINRARELHKVCSTTVSSGGEKVLSSIKKNKLSRFNIFNKSNYHAIEEERAKRVKPKTRKVACGDGLEYSADIGFDDGGFCGDCGDCGDCGCD